MQIHFNLIYILWTVELRRNKTGYAIHGYYSLNNSAHFQSLTSNKKRFYDEYLEDNTDQKKGLKPG